MLWKILHVGVWTDRFMRFDILLAIKKSSIHILFSLFGGRASQIQFPSVLFSKCKRVSQLPRRQHQAGGNSYFLCLLSSDLHLLPTVFNPALTTGATQERQWYKDNSCHFMTIQVVRVDKGWGNRKSDPFINMLMSFTQPFVLKSELDIRRNKILKYTADFKSQILNGLTLLHWK